METSKTNTDDWDSHGKQLIYSCGGTIDFSKILILYHFMT